MAQITSTIVLHQDVERVFAYFSKPANLVTLAMPEFHLELAWPRVPKSSAVCAESRALGIDADHADRNHRNPTRLVEEQRRGRSPLAA